MIDISQLSDQYQVRAFSEKDAATILRLQQSNPLYYTYCPPEPTMQTVLEEMTAFPPGKGPDDLYYVGFFHENRPVAILHFVTSYPTQDTVYLGLFMVDGRLSGHGIGSRIINDVLRSFERSGFLHVRSGYMEGNPQAKAFWEKCGFVDHIKEVKSHRGKVIVLEKHLKR